MRSLLVTVLMVAAVSCRGGDSTGSRGGEAKTPRPEMSPAEEFSTAEQWESVASLFVRDGSLLWDGVYEYTYVARATTPGSYVVPPAKAEEMYSPEVFGRSASDKVIVE